MEANRYRAMCCDGDIVGMYGSAFYLSLGKFSINERRLYYC